ncbi:glypican-5-like [Saccostrea echinata]|uniref:glypican-5-like n=1 Tax=Saccostrea echinata TaxID=191078 RepID=UPI002A7EDD95|nr:glypican-5-like [Saccostrea echinata]
MAKTCLRQYFVFFFLWTFYVSLADPDSGSQMTGCHRVKQAYLREHIGPASLVPSEPIYDGDISICFNAASKDKSEKSCCSKASELSYVTAAEKFLRKTIHTKNAYLKKLVMDHIVQYEERLENVIQSSYNRTSQLLIDLYDIPPSAHRQPLKDFYQDIRTYLKMKHVSLYGSVNSLFDSLFPYLYKYILEGKNISVTLSPEHTECLKNKRQEIIPNPFGPLPYNISHILNKALSTAKSYMDVLTLLVEAINTTDQMTLTEKCQHAVTRLQYCSHCQQEIDTKPCKGFCLNSMRRCLAQLSVISNDWNGLIMSVGRLQAWMAQKYDAEHTLNKLDGKLDTAIMHALTTSEKYINSTQQICGFRTPISSKQVLPKNIPASSSSGPLKIKREIGGEMYEKILEVMKELLTSLKMFDTIADDICDQQIFYDQDINSTQCWNGLTKGRYTEVVEDIPTLLTRTAMVIDPKLVSLKDKLAAMRVNLMTRYSDFDYARDRRQPMQSDSFKYGSGDYSLHHDHLQTDDEDLYGSSGDMYSGSGSGSTPVIFDVTMEDTRYTALPPAKKPNPAGGSSCLTVSLATVLMVILTLTVL